jgi:PST family polysaccharide transporter
MALVGNFRNFMTSLESFHFGFQNGIVKYAEIKEEARRLQNYLCCFISLRFCCCLLSGVLFFFATFWNQEIFGNNYQYQVCFQSLSLTLVCHLHLLIAVLNGLGSFKE